MKRMSDINGRLWPFGLGFALAAVPATWAGCAIAFFLMRTYLAWPGTESALTLTYYAMAVSAVPLLLLLIDFVAARGGVIGSKLLNVDFSKAIAEAGTESFALPDNILAEQDALYSSGRSKVIDVMKKATAVETVRLDLADGSTWWVTRLLALCAGALERGAPSAIVFVGRKGNREGIFLGWATPSSLLTAILNSSDDYRARAIRARMIARQLGMFGGNEDGLEPREILTSAAPPIPPRPVVLHPDVQSNREKYDANDAAMLARISIDELKKVSASPLIPNTTTRDLEVPPDRLTVARLQELFAPCLYIAAIDRLWPNARQLDTFLQTTAPYVALVRDEVYVGMVRTDLGERAILRELLRQSQREAQAGGKT